MEDFSLASTPFVVIRGFARRSRGHSAQVALRRSTKSILRRRSNTLPSNLLDHLRHVLDGGRQLRLRLDVGVVAVEDELHKIARDDPADREWAVDLQEFSPFHISKTHPR